jgi:RNA polymerase sigma factor (sigma-70 family)
MSSEDTTTMDMAAGHYERIVGAIVTGDQGAEQAFALRFMRPVKAMLMARLRNADQAEDLLQDVMIECICALRRGQLREPPKLPGFVSAVARNLLNHHFRTGTRRPTPLELPDDLPALPPNPWHAEEQERENLALEAISSLEPLDKTILQMTLVDGLKPGSIAEKLRMDSNVVRQRKLRATRRVIDFVMRLSQNDSGVHIVTRRKS